MNTLTGLEISMNYIDLRSDTVTWPTDEMRKAMMEAGVGDDVYGDDPSVNRLQEMAAEMMHKEAALFVPSGTMGNQLAVFTHTNRGDEVIIPEDNHIVVHEAGAPAIISGVNLRCLPSDKGMMDLKKAEAAIRFGEDIHEPRTGLICTENAHSTGIVHPLSYMEELYDIARKNNVPLHLDGARIFNAASRLNVEAWQIAQYSDSVMFCLSKGLCAPVGSMLAGTKGCEKKTQNSRRRDETGGNTCSGWNHCAQQDDKKGP
jgi:threonine aldolase